jgi:hydroxymethylpyrimidine pyrophosphatase-like HAD family hydrolase
MTPIRLIYSDNEGCILPGKGLPFPLDDLNRLRRMLKRLRSTGDPASDVHFSICSGRSIAYIEAMLQVLDLQNSHIPCVCEGGAVLYWPYNDTWEPLAPPPEREALLQVVKGMDYRPELGKAVCLSLYPNPPTRVADLFAAYQSSPLFNSYHITWSPAAVDITPRGVNKFSGLKEACRRLGLTLEEVLTVGDAANDIPMLEGSGFSACPANAVLAAKEVVDYVSPSPATKGLFEILDHFFGQTPSGDMPTRD